MSAGAGQVGRARAFARAALDLASDPAQAENIISELDSLVGLVRAERDLATLLESPLLSPRSKAESAIRLFGGRFSELTVRLLQVMADHDALDLLALVVEQCRLERDERLGRVRVEAVTAAPMDEAGRRLLTGRLSELVGGPVVLVERTEPEIIGGLALRIGDTVLDGSVRQRLEQVRRQITARGEHEIQVGRNLVAD